MRIAAFVTICTNKGTKLKHNLGELTFVLDSCGVRQKQVNLTNHGAMVVR